MIQETTTHYDIFPTYNWEDRDRQVADVLTYETECKLKELIVEITQAVLSSPVVGKDAVEVEMFKLQRSYNLGRIDALRELLEQSRDAKEQAKTTQT